MWYFFNSYLKRVISCKHDLIEKFDESVVDIIDENKRIDVVNLSLDFLNIVWCDFIWFKLCMKSEWNQINLI